MKERSITINAILNIVRYITSMLFPLITFPYVTRILSVENLGKVNYANSIVSYFILIAGLGYPTFAVREGVRVRNDREKMDRFASQIFSMNMLSTTISYVFFLMLMIFVPALKVDYLIMVVLSVQMIAMTLGMDWINTVYEEFGYIAVRTIVCQILSMAVLFLFLKKSTDALVYAFVIVFSSVGVNIWNLFHVRKFCKIRLTVNIPWKIFTKPILLIFFSSLSSTIYTNMDVTMLGMIWGEHEVGIYSCALKIYRILKQIMIAFIYVYEPRISGVADDKNRFSKIVEDLFNRMIFLMSPICVGVICVSRQTIMILASDKYLEATIPLIILMFSLICATIAYFVMHAILLPLRLEKYIGICSLTGAMIDMVMNLILIKICGCSGAALATLLAEFTVMISAGIIAKRYFMMRIDRRCICQIGLAVSGIIVISMIQDLLFYDILLNFIMTVLFGIFTYILILFLLKNVYIIKGIQSLHDLVRRKR